MALNLSSSCLPLSPPTYLAAEAVWVELCMAVTWNKTSHEKEEPEDVQEPSSNYGDQTEQFLPLSH